VGDIQVDRNVNLRIERRPVCVWTIDFIYGVRLSDWKLKRVNFGLLRFLIVQNFCPFCRNLFLLLILGLDFGSFSSLNLFIRLVRKSALINFKFKTLFLFLHHFGHVLNYRSNRLKRGGRRSCTRWPKDLSTRHTSGPHSLTRCSLWKAWPYWIRCYAARTWCICGFGVQLLFSA
jgi:hypothetical protein